MYMQTQKIKQSSRGLHKSGSSIKGVVLTQEMMERIHWTEWLLKI